MVSSISRYTPIKAGVGMWVPLPDSLTTMTGTEPATVPKELANTWAWAARLYSLLKMSLRVERRKSLLPNAACLEYHLHPHQSQRSPCRAVLCSDKCHIYRRWSAHDFVPSRLPLVTTFNICKVPSCQWALKSMYSVLLYFQLFDKLLFFLDYFFLRKTSWRLSKTA